MRSRLISLKKQTARNIFALYILSKQTNKQTAHYIFHSSYPGNKKRHSLISDEYNPASGGKSTHGTTRLTLLPVNQTGTSDSVQDQDRPQPPQLSSVFQTPHRPYRAGPLRYCQSDNRTSTAVLPHLRATQKGNLARPHPRSPQAPRQSGRSGRSLRDLRCTATFIEETGVSI